MELLRTCSLAQRSFRKSWFEAELLPELRREVAEAAELLAKNHDDHGAKKPERKSPRAGAKPERARKRSRKTGKRGH